MLRRAFEDPNGDGRTDDSVLANTLFIVTSDNGACVGFFPPYKDHKASIYEGGHRVPFIVRWPAHVRPGTRSDVLFGLQDLFATFAALTGTAVDKESARDSQDMLAALTGTGAGRRELLLQSQGGSPNFALRDGPWKLVSKAEKPLELYELESDPGERTNLAERDPARVAAMRTRLVELVGAERLIMKPPQKKGPPAAAPAR